MRISVLSVEVLLWLYSEQGSIRSECLGVDVVLKLPVHIPYGKHTGSYPYREDGPQRLKTGTCDAARRRALRFFATRFPKYSSSSGSGAKWTGL